MKVFISGSRNFDTIKFNKYKEMFEWLKSNNHEVLVGDCYGIDARVQTYCNTLGIKHTVYYIGDKPRNISDSAIPHKINGYKQTDKDIEMIKDCDFGIAIWNGISKGTKNNIENLKRQFKQVIVRR